LAKEVALVRSVHPILAVITARGGSKGLPGKNIRTLAGMPLIVHSIKLAAMCKEIDTVIVSTDSEEIAAVATEYGARVPFIRPAELATDSVGTIPVLQHALQSMKEIEQRHFGSVLLLDPTSPGRLPEHVSAAVKMLDADADADGVVACSRPKFNPYFVGVVNADGYMQRALGETSYTHRQDVPPFYRINGSLYLWRAEFLRETQPTWQEGRHLLLEVPEELAFSIDDLMEFQVADFIISSGLVKLPWVKIQEGAAR
jgi:CMP-N,N'-diacetyllegionaminic acid synthase